MKARAVWGTAAAVLISAGVFTATASAHTAPIVADCDAGLSVALTDYSGDGVNTLRVWIDGAARATTTFGASTSATFSFGDPTVSHTWRVSVAAWDDPTGEMGWTFDTGTRDIPVCAKPTTTVASAPATPTTKPAEAPTTLAPPTTVPLATVPPTTPTTATVGSAVVTAPAGSGGAPVTTSVVAQAGPTSVVAGDSSLPVTGAADVRAIGIGLLLLGFGILLIVATRRPDAA
jgi:hypothetical protein